MDNNKSRESTRVLLASLTACSITLFAAMDVKAASKRFYHGRVSASVAAADSLMMKGKYADAAKYYQSAIKKNPKDVNANIGYGMALAKQFKVDGAEDQFNKALKRDPNNPGAHAGKALNMLNRLQSSSNTIRKNRDSILREAEAEAQKALDANLDIPESHYAMGMVYKEQGRLNEAANELKKAISMDSKYNDGYTGLGMIQLAQNNPGAAAANFKQSIRLNSGDWTAHYGLGQSLLTQGQTDAALKELNIAQYQFPNSWPVRLALGKAYESQGNTVAAVREYQESIRIKPENPAAYLGIANVREVRGDIEHSIAELRSGLELMPDNADLQSRIGDQSLRVEKIDDAIKAYQAVLNAQPGNARAADGLTTAYYMKANKETTGGYFGDNDFDDALAMLDRAVQMNPNDMKLRLAQAKLRSLAGEEVDLAALGTPRNDGERVSYAQALMAQNRFQEANQEIQTVLNNTNNPKQIFSFADLLLMVHDLDNAEAAYKKASTTAGGAERARRGLTQVAKNRENARKSLTLATDLSRKHMTGSAVDTFHEAVFSNPKSAEARIGLAKALENVSKPTPVQLRETAFQYRAYVALSPAMPEKEQQKFLSKATKLDDKAGKRERKMANAVAK
ncbi:tetratricopeptide repeat protein [Candidatus Obscuribacterales bacterium]|nr:tetratricopeptide repeat protein [Candidatus Obscuribacterales bacterium]MBX3136216.1 tetratricopeptide repeat protein [Candidatus Obscuribacterales bacterium]